MSVLSKLFFEHFVTISCKDLAHLNDSCFNASMLALRLTFKNSLVIYSSLYTISALLRGRSLKYYYTKLPKETIRSSVFLAVNCFSFLAAFCLSRKFFGNVNYWGTLLFNIPACFLSIILERKERRGLLALYLTNLAAETGFNMMVHRKWVSIVPNGEVLLFSLASAIYALLFKMEKLDKGIYKLMKNLVGPSETSETEHMKRKSHIMSCYGLFTDVANKAVKLCNNLSAPRYLAYLLKKFEIKFEHLLNRMSDTSKCRHPACNHRYNCFLYPVLGFVQRFIVGFLMQAIVKAFGSMAKIIKNPKFLFQIMKNPVNRQLGMFIGSYVFIYRSISCLYRWVTNKNNKISGLIAGFFAGWSMLFFKSSSIALYLNFKLLEILWMLGVANKKLPLFKSFDVILYALSTAFVLWVALFEPHNIRYSYWKFMVNISNNKFVEVNRFALDSFGTDASLLDRLGKA